MTARTDAFDRWIKCFHPSPDSRVRLICLPHAGGSASGWFPLSRQLTPGVEVWSVQYPGRQERRRETPVADVRRLAGALADVLAGQLDRPYALMGHSMGATVGFELARLLEAGPGPAPEALIASGRRAPGTVRDERVHRLDDAGVAAELRLLSGTDPTFLKDPELLAMIMPALRADYRAIETYRAEPGAAVACPVTGVVGDRDPRTSLDEARAWAAHTSGGCDVRVVAGGGHFFLEDRLDEVVGIVGDVVAPIALTPRG